jgi:hypothetical protein
MLVSSSARPRSSARRAALGLRLHPPQDGAQPRRQLARRARLGDVVVRAQLEADDAVHVVAPRREHDHRDAARLPDAAQRLHAVHARHHHVEHHDVEVAFDRALRRARAIVHGADRKAVPLEVLGEHVAQLDVVVCQEHARHARDDTGALPSVALLYAALRALYAA